MRLLFVLSDRPNYPGGPIINCLRLLPRFVKANYSVDLLVPYFHDSYPNAEHLATLGVTIHPKKGNQLYTEDLTKWMLGKIEEIQPDVFIPDVSLPGCFAAKWLRKSGIPVITAQHSIDENNSGRTLYFGNPGSPFAATGIVFHGKYLKDAFLRNVPNATAITKVIPTGIELPSDLSVQENGGLKIIYAGRLVEPAKRIIDTLNALIHLCLTHADVEITFVGDGPERSRCEALVNEHGLQERITFTGLLLGEEYKRELARHNVIVLLSDYEGLPGAIMDGMACGLVPVCTSFTGVDELITDGVSGLLVQDRKESFFSAIDILREDPVRRQVMSKNARKQIEENHAIDVMLDRWRSLIAECQKVTGARRTFHQPARIRLPDYTPQLLEYIPKPGLMETIRGRIQLRTRIRALLTESS